MALSPRRGIYRQRNIIEDLAESLQCPVCLELPQKTIYSCVTGHIVCSRCHGMLNACPLCRRKYAGTRNFLAETLANTITVLLGQTPPRVSTAGSPVVRCCLSVNGCRNQVMDASSYIEHLVTVHGAFVVATSSGKFVHRIMVAPTAKTYVKLGTDRLFIMEVAGKSFVINTFQEGTQLQIWAETELSTLGTKLSKVEFSIRKAGHGRISWTGDVNGHHVTEKSVLITRTCLKVATAQMRDCLDVDANGARSWFLEVKICSSAKENVFGNVVSRTILGVEESVIYASRTVRRVLTTVVRACTESKNWLLKIFGIVPLEVTLVMLVMIIIIYESFKLF